MSFKKILAAVMASCVACGAFAVSAVELDVAESANEAVVAEEAALAEEEISAWADVADTSWYNTADASFTVDTAAEFAGLAKLVNEGTESFAGKTVTLGADIDLGQIDWTSIGTASKPFLGTFDGNGKTIFNLWCGTDQNGLFGYTSSGNRAENYGNEAIIKNFTLDSVFVGDGAQKHNGAGAVVGCGNMYTTISNVTVKNDVVVIGARAGGILGYAYSGAVIDNCHVDGAYDGGIGVINALYWACGGIMGFGGPDGNVVITNSTVKNININAVNHYGAGGILGNGGSGKVENVAVENVTCSVAYANDAVYYISGGPKATGDVYVAGVTAKVNDEVVEVTGEDLTNVTKVAASFNGTYYEKLSDAIKAAKDGGTVVVYEVEEGAIKLPAVIKNLTLEGNGTAVIKNTTISASDGNSVNYQGFNVQNITFENSRFILNGQRGGEVVYKDLVFNNNKFLNITATGNVAALHMNLDSDETLENFTFTNNVIDGVSGSSNSGVVIKHATGNVIFDNNTITNVAWNALQIFYTKANANVVISNNTFASGANEGVLNLNGTKSGVVFENNTFNLNEGQKEVCYFTTVATIGKVSYSSLEAAIAAAKDGDTIVLSEGVYALSSFKNNITIKAAEGANVVFDCGAAKQAVNGNVNFVGVTFNWSNAGHCGLQHSDVLTYTDCVINGQPFLYGASDIFTNCVFNQEDENNYNVWTYSSANAVFNNCTFYSAGRSVLVYRDGGDDTLNVSFEKCVFYASKPADGKAAIEIAGASGPYNVTANNCTANGFAKGSKSGDSLWNVKNFSEGKAVVVMVNGVDEFKSNNTVKVNFVKADVDANGVDNYEESDIYNINIVGANDAVINRLNSGELTFAFTSDKPMAYEILDIAGDNITVTNVEGDDYEFHFETKTNVTNDTAKIITVAQVKFTGYGKYNFAVVDGAVHATTGADNIVDSYTPDGIVDNGEGKFDISEKLEGLVINVPTRELTVNVTFPNSVVDRDAKYQDMTVTISGGDLAEAIVTKLGDNSMNDAAYTVTANLTKNIAYNVTVSGAGYRTARYTVTMTDAKTLNFWNNVKDNKVEVEEGKASSATEKNFLAGDIVADNQINIYDLSAVVSYFATEITDEADYEKYVKYDLNRDGVINSKDVAYVLVSWQA